MSQINDYLSSSIILHVQHMFSSWHNRVHTRFRVIEALVRIYVAWKRKASRNKRLKVNEAKSHVLRKISYATVHSKVCIHYGTPKCPFK